MGKMEGKKTNATNSMPLIYQQSRALELEKVEQILIVLITPM